jgi:hypothetical protein
MGKYLLQNKKVEQNSRFPAALLHDFCIPLPVHRQKKRVASNWIYAVPATRCGCILSLRFSKSQGWIFSLLALVGIRGGAY